MPWVIERREGKFCVVKQGTGAVVNGGCHDSRIDAVKQQRALYASEPRAASLVADLAPLAPPRSFFEHPEADGPQPLTFYEDGSVDGHLALWDTCHSGFQGGAISECVRAPKTRTNYRMFHLGQIQTAEGETLAVGKLTYATGHAPLTADMQRTTAHYDNTGSVGAYVRASDGRYGIWLSGAVRSDLTPEGLRDLRANPPSGDWRALNGNLELVAALSVPVPGFPIPQSQLALAAAGVSALILPAPTQDDLEEVSMPRSKSYIRERAVVQASLTAAVLTTEARKALPRSAFAIPETREYPIHDRIHAQEALSRSSGKPEEARVRRAVCRRYPNMGECAS